MTDSFTVDAGPILESKLVDLGSVSLAELRWHNGAMLDHSLQHVVEQTAFVRVAADSSGGAERID